MPLPSFRFRNIEIVCPAQTFLPQPLPLDAIREHDHHAQKQVAVHLTRMYSLARMMGGGNP